MDGWAKQELQTIATAFDKNTMTVKTAKARAFGYLGIDVKARTKNGFLKELREKLDALKQNPAPKRKTAARTQRAAEAYVRRPSQITKKAPSKRLKKRRTVNLQSPRGVFPNPSMSAAQVRKAFNAAWRERVRYVPAYKNDIPAKREFFSTFIDGLYEDGLITERMLNNVTMEGAARKNPDSVHFDIDVNSHNARGAKAKTRVNPSARKKQIVVEYELSGQKFAIRNRGMYGWKELATFPDTPEGSENAIQYAQAYHNIAPHLRIQVVTK